MSLVNIPGFTYPVRELYLEDVLERTGFVVGQYAPWRHTSIALARNCMLISFLLAAVTWAALDGALVAGMQVRPNVARYALIADPLR